MTTRDPGRFSPRIRAQIALITVVTAATLAATWQFSQAGGAYQDAVRQEIKRQAGVQEEVRQVYGVEGPQAFRVAVARAEAEALSPLRDDGRLAASQYTIASESGFLLRDSTGLPESSFHSGLGYDLPGRLGDLQAASPGVHALDPDARLRSGDRWAAWALGSVMVAVAAVAAALIAANVLRPVAWRRPPAPGGRRVLRTLELIPQPATAPPGTRLTVGLNLLIVALLFLLPLGQVYAAGGEQRAQAEAARRAVQVRTDIAVSGQLQAFRLLSRQEALAAAFRAEARQLAAIDAADPEVAGQEARLAAVERGLARTVQAMSAYMARTPARADGVDKVVIAGLRTDPADQPALTVDQNHQVDLAQRSGNRGLLLAVATAFAVVGEVLAASALVAGRRWWVLWPVTATVVSLVLTGAAVR
ncbi:hypothetical protein ACFUIY_18660 [Streptomyces griseorubiginosus]|uniref:hypothetical protein n=1 Tax=Streptomyces griseorubiginosus TaxID=67304 RepID=UPI00363EB2D7